jgi:hypothetical protein
MIYESVRAQTGRSAPNAGVTEPSPKYLCSRELSARLPFYSTEYCCYRMGNTENLQEFYICFK